jgi:SanA protein
MGLVLGTDLKSPDGSLNLHFQTRTTAAAKAYTAGKIKHLIISGNPNNRGFNEPLDIQKALLTNGVPESAMTLDSTGITTWDSIHAAVSDHPIKKITLITDAFRAPRALFLCRHFGIDAVAFCDGRKPAGYWLYRSELREYFARVKAFFQASLD